MLTPVAQFFSKDGLLAHNMSHYETRHMQQEVALAVEKALTSQTRLLVEAGTGVGKSMAYLVPAIFSGLKVVVSTATKNLQEQLVFKDIPLIECALGKKLRVEVMKGRANYLCELRAEQFLAQPPLPGHTQLQQQHHMIEAFRNNTHTGDKAELTQLPDNATLWRDVSATSEQCLFRMCKHYDNCFVTNMRRRAQTADLIIVNHHLYLADAQLKDMRRDDDSSATLLPGHDVVIFDEAHELDEIATQHFGVHVSDKRLADLEHDVQQMLPQHDAACHTAFQAAHKYCGQIYNELPFGPHRQRLDSYLATEGRRSIQAHYQNVEAHLAVIQSRLMHIDKEETRHMARRVAQFADDLAFVLNLPAASSLSMDNNQPATTPMVRYSEANFRTRTIVAMPIDVANMLGKIVNRMPSIFLSATLRINQRFDNFRQRIGLHEATELVVASPFDYQKNVKLYLPLDLPDPDDAQFNQAMIQRSLQLIEASNGGALILCTSNKVMHLMKAAFEAILHPYTVMMQGDAPKHVLLEQLTSNMHAVLIATLSFWKGVDVPGQALRLVIIDRLPFASPTDPIVAARLEHMQKQGQDAFMGYQIPLASILLRQGFGRLIRRQTDTGVVAILDKRLKVRRYGPLLLSNLPSCEHIHDTQTICRILSIMRQ